MTKSFHKGQKVTWTWGEGIAHGMVPERFERRVSRTIKETRIVRAGTADNPAYLVEQADGGRVLKRGSELTAAR